MITLLALLALSSVEGLQDGPIASPESGWPQWRGKRRDGVVEEKGLLKAWPAGGPKLLWKAEGIGKGWSSPVIVGDRIFISGDEGEELVVRALDLDGREVWKRTNGKSWKASYPGARATCAVSEGAVYLLNSHGRLACLDARSGEERWAADVASRFAAKVHTWAYSEGVVVDGPRVLVTAGGAKGLVVALDKKTGETVWATEGVVGDDCASYVSPLLVKHGERRLLLGATVEKAFGVDVDAGKLLWSIPMKTPYGVTASTPAYSSGRVHYAAAFITAAAWNLLDGGAKVEKAWDTAFDTCSGSFILVDGVLYGGGHKRVKGWAALDWASGERKAELNFGTGASIWADGRLYALAEDGRMALLTSASEGFAIASEFRLTPERVSDAWAHPVLLDGRLYLRYHGELRCYTVAGIK